MAIHQGMQWKAITRKRAEYIGMAASVAGGFVAIEGERLARGAAPRLPDYPDDYDYECYDHDMDELRETGAVRITGGDYAWISDGGYLVLAAPEGHPIADDGWSIPVELVREWLDRNPQYADKLTIAAE